MNLTRVGVDLAKHVFQVHGVDRQEQVQVKRALSRRQMLSYFARQALRLLLEP